MATTSHFCQHFSCAGSTTLLYTPSKSEVIIIYCPQRTFCRLAQLPDLDQSEPYVSNYLINWTSEVFISARRWMLTSEWYPVSLISFKAKYLSWQPVMKTLSEIRPLSLEDDWSLQPWRPQGGYGLSHQSSRSLWEVSFSDSDSPSYIDSIFIECTLWSVAW